MSRLKIVHRTGFSYELPATASYNEARMLPVSNSDQFVLQARLDIHPQATQHSYVDYWGTQVSTFEVLTPHTELSVTATSLVEVRPHSPAGKSISWDELALVATSSTAFVEFCHQTPLTTPHKEIRVQAQKIAAVAETPLSAAHEISRRVHEHIAYVQGVTGVQTTAQHAWEARHGVCQDIAHVTIGALRSVGIPARYVSGYLQSKPDASIGETILGESHAWVEWFSGEWQGFDPTNLLEIEDRHVLIARGRDYRDVSPLRGVYAGASASDVFVTVEITKEG